MILTLHNPSKPKRGTKNKTKRATRRTPKQETTTMAKKKKKSATRKKARARKTNPATKKRSSARRSTAKRRPTARASSTHKRRRNPANPSPKRSKGRRRRRRNPGDTSAIAKQILVGSLAATLAGGAVILGATAAAPSGKAKIAYYGLAAAGIVAGVALSKKHPAIGAGIASGAVTATLATQVGAFAASKLLAPAMSGIGELGGMGEIAVGAPTPKQLGMGEVVMGEVVAMGDLADRIASGPNPFAR